MAADAFDTSRSWVLNGLPDQPGTVDTHYTFDLGHLGFALDLHAFYLHINEITHRDAEGRALYPEQEEWVNRIIAQRGIGARQIWFSWWQFTGLEDVRAFEKILWGLGAFRQWGFARVSNAPGVLLEKYKFKITPAEDGTLWVRAEVDPPDPLYRGYQSDMIDKILEQNRIPVRKIGETIWQLLTPEEASAFESGLKVLGACTDG